MDKKIFTLPRVLGVAVAVPKERLILKDLQFDNTNTADIIKVTGIEEVRRAPEDKTVTDYCMQAISNLFSALNFDKNKLDGIVFSTSMSDYLTPGSGYVLQERLDLPTNCIVVDMNQACAGYVNGLFQAFMLIQSGYCKNVLLCVGDVRPMINPKDKSMMMLMGDAGAVSLISASENPSPSTFSFYNYGQGWKFIYIPVGGKRMSRKAGVTDVEHVDEQGNVRTLQDTYMNGLEVMTFAMDAVPDTVGEVLKNLGWKKEDVSLFGLHQANGTMVKALTKRLRVLADKVPVSFKHFGNTSASSVPLTLCLNNPNSVSKWSKSVLCGFGNGLACATVGLDLSETYFCELQEI